MANAWRTTLRLILMSKERGRGPNATPPPTRVGDLTLPTRARPVPFCRYSFAVDPETSPLVFDEAVPRRRAACSARTTRCSVLMSAGTANSASARSRVSTEAPDASTNVALPGVPRGASTSPDVSGSLFTAAGFATRFLGAGLATETSDCGSAAAAPSAAPSRPSIAVGSSLIGSCFVSSAAISTYPR